MMQIKIMERTLAKLDKDILKDIKLYIVGSCRDAQDEVLLENLKKEVDKRELNKSIEFIKNPPFKDLLDIF